MFIKEMIMALISFYSVVCEQEKLNEIQEELIECVTDHTMKGDLQKVVFAFFKLESEAKKIHLIEKYKNFINIKPEHCGIDEKFALNLSSPIVEIFEIMSGHTRINGTVINRENIGNYSDDENNSNSSEDEIKFSDRHSNTLKEKDTDGSNFDRQGTIKLYFKDENKSMEHKLKHSFDRLDSSNSEDEKTQVKRESEINPFDSNNFPLRHRLYSDKHIHTEIVTIDDIKQRLRVKPYNKAILQLRKIEQIEEPRKKLRLMGEVNDIILECINQFWKGLNIDEEQLVITTDQMTLIYLYIVARSKIVEFFAHLKYITEFTTPYVRNSNLGFYLATYEHALYTLMQYNKIDIMDMKNKGVPPIIDLTRQTSSNANLQYLDNSANSLLRATMIPDEFIKPDDPFIEMSQNGSYMASINK